MPSHRRQQAIGTFKRHELGFVRMDIRHLSKLETANGERRRHHLTVALGHSSRWVHPVVQDGELTGSPDWPTCATSRPIPMLYPKLSRSSLPPRTSCFRTGQQCHELASCHGLGSVDS